MGKEVLEARETYDMLGRTIILPERNEPKIVSLVPSQTELLYDLGLEKQIVGQTLFCIHPKESFEKATKVGGTKKLNLKKIEAINPDIIIANKEENSKEEIEFLSARFTVWVSDINTLEDNYLFIQRMGELFNKTGQAAFINQQIKMSMAIFQGRSVNLGSAVYFIWNNPLMVAGKSTFIHQMLKTAGFDNSIIENRYPEISEEDLVNLSPKTILLSSEPFPFKKKHKEEFQKLLPNAKVIIVDGEMFSWYGSRLKYAASYFNQLQQEVLSA